MTNSTTVHGGHERDIRNGIMLAAVQCLAGASRAVDIRARAYDELSTLTRETASRSADAVEDRSAPHSRARLAALSTELSALRLDLAFGVEAYKDVALVLPHFRIAGYHRAVIEMMRLEEGAATIRALLQQLSEASASALAAVERREREADEAARAKEDDRSRVVAGVATVLGAVAVPLTLVFAFLGVNASEVNPDRSILSLSDYWPWYALIAVLCIGAFALSWAPETFRRRRARLAASSSATGSSS